MSKSPNVPDGSIVVESKERIPIPESKNSIKRIVVLTLILLLLVELRKLIYI